MTDLKKRINMQPTYNIGLAGSAGGGKSTLAKILGKKKTQMHSAELSGQHTINICFTNSFTYQNEKGKLFIPDKKEKNLEQYKIINCFSLIDCPGHSALLFKTLASIELMDAVIIVIPLNEDIKKQSELLQHLLVVKAMNIKKIIVLLNKIDLINDKKIILENKNEIENLFDELKIEPCSYIPTCLSKGLGINEILYDINKYFFENDNIENINNMPKNDPLIVLRSWDVNSVHIPYNKIKPGIIGGTGGSYQDEDKVLILPGYIINDKSYKPYELTIKNMETDRKIIYGKSKPGGLIGISFNELDPTISKNNQLVGNIMCLKTDKYDVYSEITVTIDMFPNEHILKKWKPKVNQKIYCIINAKTREGTIKHCKRNNITFKLDNPICPTKNKIILLTSKNNQYIPIGIGEIKKGIKLKCIE